MENRGVEFQVWEMSSLNGFGCYTMLRIARYETELRCRRKHFVLRLLKSNVNRMQAGSGEKGLRSGKVPAAYSTVPSAP